MILSYVLKTGTEPKYVLQFNYNSVCVTLLLLEGFLNIFLDPAYYEN